MTATKKDDDDDGLLPIGVDSLSDYTPHKLHLLLSLPIPGNVETSTINNNDNSLNLLKQSSNKAKQSSSKPKQSSDEPKKSSKKTKLFRYFMPITRIRASSAYNEQDKYYQQQTPIKPVDQQCDMRFFIIRHGERVDRYFGSNWYMLAFDQQNQFHPYHRNFPPSLPLRSNKLFWALDTPLTLSGLNAAKKLGQTLASKNFKPHYVYSSPAMRCIFTTIQILKGLGLENRIPIRIEPGLLEIGAARYGMSVFFQPNDWIKNGIYVDSSYQPIITTVPPYEHENTYYLRSKYVIRGIEKLHNNSSLESMNILIIAHATSPETLTWDLLGKEPNVNDLYTVSLDISYLQTVITERKQENKSWSLKTG
ncbi:unnamed protein product [Rotaria sordida]|uniref:Uncharacterized protein n=1 Tax=Rotaria sordida TaxID=392033 RepID=A0A813WE89_9BILA|nr:unnamed protein product [Rotaria sordida]CAF0906003.1 unnamed protein product [Rotaria sordida]CAF3591050.1 unnamed protein product [Rotaria sordida]CAF3649534.1 unnamed protein product [Rotaria sordida]